MENKGWSYIYACDNLSQRKIVLKNQYFRYSFTLEFYLPVCKDFTYELTDREVRYKMYSPKLLLLFQRWESSWLKRSPTGGHASSMSKRNCLGYVSILTGSSGKLCRNEFIRKIEHNSGMRARRRRKMATSRLSATKTCWGPSILMPMRNSRRRSLAFSTSLGASKHNIKRIGNC